MGVILLLGLITTLVSFLVIYENGILIRNPSYFTFFKRSYIDFEYTKEIREDIEKHQGRYGTFDVGVIYILTNQGKLYKMDDSRVSKLDEAKNLIEASISKKR